MLTAVVTGAAGFIGSHLCDRLLRDGWTVRGVDAFVPGYARATKEANLAIASRSERFSLRVMDPIVDDLTPVVSGCHVVFHLAAQAGVRTSWGADFETYVRNNVLLTQRVLEIAAGRVHKLVYASSSSVYGDAIELPVSETAATTPVSPYGVTKLAGEQLCRAYARARGLRCVALRYFSVYGPRQRPDMAFSRFTAAIRSGAPIEVYGDGLQTRDFTYVDDVVDATVRAATTEFSDEFVNVAGGSQSSLIDAIERIGELVGRSPTVVYRPAQPGDVRDTFADVRRAAALFDYRPMVTLGEGLRRQVEWTLAVGPKD